MRSLKKSLLLACAASLLSIGGAIAQTTPPAAPDAPAAIAPAADAPAAKPVVKKPVAKKRKKAVKKK